MCLVILNLSEPWWFFAWVRFELMIILSVRYPFELWIKCVLSIRYLYTMTCTQFRHLVCAAHWLLCCHHSYSTCAAYICCSEDPSKKYCAEVIAKWIAAVCKKTIISPLFLGFASALHLTSKYMVTPILRLIREELMTTKIRYPFLILCIISFNHYTCCETALVLFCCLSFWVCVCRLLITDSWCWKEVKWFIECWSFLQDFLIASWFPSFPTRKSKLHFLCVCYFFKQAVLVYPYFCNFSSIAPILWPLLAITPFLLYPIE